LEISRLCQSRPASNARREPSESPVPGITLARGVDGFISDGVAAFFGVDGCGDASTNTQALLFDDGKAERVGDG
jgi:hypothetical protein